MVSSTLVLVAGFGSLALSGFGWNRELGLLGSVVLLLALLSDVVLATAGLAVYGRWVDRPRRRPSTRPADGSGRSDEATEPGVPAPAAASLVAPTA